MNTILLIIRREYLVRVRKKSFLVMTILTPILLSALFILPAYFAARSVDEKKVEVIDESGLFGSSFKKTKALTYQFVNMPVAEAKKNFAKSGYDVLVHIPKTIEANPKTLKIYAEKNVSLDVKDGIEKAVEQKLENLKLMRAGITQEVLDNTKVDVSADTYSLSDAGEKDSSSGAATAVGYLCAFAIYISIFIYGAQVMRGVLEEKTNRIVEVIISSVKPYQLMAGKITGVALVGLTQFLLWILLTTGLSSVTAKLLPQDKAPSAQVSQQTTKPANTVPTVTPASRTSFVSAGLSALGTLNAPLIIACFLFYFLGGYLMYSALFAAIGAAVDNETDTQQFMMPLTIPIIFSIAMAQFVMREPDGTLAFWMSMIPFTSPIIMMVRIPFGVPVWEIALSMILVVLGFMGTIWLAARIYRVGILMYGKKTTYRELSKWIFYKV